MLNLKGNNGRTIQIVFGDAVYESNRDTYIIDLPMVICNDKKVAEFIREEINRHLGNLSEKLLNESRGGR